MEVKIKRLHPDAVIPKYAKDGDAGMDLKAIDHYIDNDANNVYRTGLAIEIPKGYVGLLFPRSSNSKKNQYLTNCVGVIDSGYRGEITFKFRPNVTMINPLKFWWWQCVLNKTREYYGMNYYINDSLHSYKVGDRIGQLIIMPYPQIAFTEVEELSETERGERGYGSTGK